ncbi:MAG: gliding motility-associated C-terminal domain-containing protein, partial [Bacteroidia bacterium]|nr:gliding motility-associated C-terminal domain-containing protein [Bacteroidia bacterium]
VGQKLTGTIHCNGIDFWIVSHDTTNQFYSYLLTSTGVNPVPVISSAGSTYSIFPELGMRGQMKISPNGGKLATAIYQTSTLSNNSFELFDFDNSTGIVANPISLLNGDKGAYGCEFSADGSKFYGNNAYYSTPISPRIYQWDLCAGSASAIVASQMTIAANAPASANFGAMQLAPDGKIYIARYNQQFLGVINSPNSLGSACNYIDQGQSVASSTVQLGLPNFMTYMLLQHVSPGPFTYTASPNFGCQTAQFTAPPSVQVGSVIACSSAGYSLSSVKWDFGDPSSGLANTSTQINPTHTFSQLGTYTTQLILYYTCGGGTDTIRQTVNINQLCISLSSQSITCSSLGSATANISNGIGPFSYTWQPGNQNTQVVTGLAPGTYTVIVHDAGSGVTSQTTTTFNSLIPLTGNLSNSGSIACNGASTGTAAYANIAGGSANQQYFWSNGLTTFTSTSSSYTNVSAGTWTSQVTDVLTGCQIYSVFTVSQPPALTLNISAASPTSCVNSSITLSSTLSGGSGGYTYTWSNGSQSQQAVITETVSGIHTYTLTGSDINSCSVSNTIQVNIIPLPSLSVSDVSICPLEVGTLYANGASSYTWVSTTLNATGSFFSDSPTVSTQYTLAGTAQSCTASVTASIILKPLPFISIAASSPLCEGEDLLLAAYGGTSYAWAGPNNFTSRAQSPQILQSQIVNTGVYQVTVTGANSCTAATQGTVLINATPTITVSPNVTVCSSQTLNLSANSVAGSNYFWTGPQSFTSSTQNPLLSNFSQTGLMNYTVKVTSPQNCTNTAVSSASVVPPPNLNISLSSASLCALALNGSPNSITLTSSGANTYTLITPLHITSTSPTGPISPISTQPPFSTGVATATLFGSNGICTESLTATFNVIPNPSLTVTSPTPVICAGESFTYTSHGAASYTWGPNSPNLTTYSVGEIAVVNPSINSVFSVMGGSLGCYSAIKVLTLTVYPLPEVKINPISPVICLKNSTLLEAGGSGTSFTWAPSLGLSGIFGNTVIASPLATQEYTLVGSANNCTSSAVITVAVLPLPNPGITLNKTMACLNEEIVFTGYGGTLYHWSGPSLFDTRVNPLKITADNAFRAGTYTLTVTDENGCKASQTASIGIYEQPEGYLKGAMEGCVPFSSEYHFQRAYNASDNIVASWIIERQHMPQEKFFYSFTSPGEYSITGQYLDTLTHCVNTQHYIVKALPRPKANFRTEPEKPVENAEAAQFINTSEGENVTTYNWYFFNNEGPQSQQKNTSYQFADPGTYLVAMEVTNAYGCKDTILKRIEVQEDFTFFVPNVFTPNGDERNEVFLPIIRGIKHYEMSIFDRWGARLFHTQDLSQGWDGVFAGQECKQDTYVWKISLSTKSGIEKVYSGAVLLTR